MRIIALLLSLLLCRVSYGQFAIISDKDGYSNIRMDTGLGSKIVDTLHNGHFVYIVELEGRWTKIEYSIRGHMGNWAHVFHDRLKPLAEYEHIPRISEDKYLFRKDSIAVEVTGKPFVKSSYRLTYDKGSLIEINGKGYWGTDGDVPKKAYKSIIVTIGANVIALPGAAYEDLFQPSLHTTRAYYDRRNDIIYITAENSDGAGSYEVVWKIEKGVYADRYIAYGF